MKVEVLDAEGECEVLAGQFAEMRNRFESLSSAEALEPINSGLDEPLAVLSQEAWEELAGGGEGSGPAARAELSRWMTGLLAPRGR